MARLHVPVHPHAAQSLAVWRGPCVAEGGSDAAPVPRGPDPQRRHPAGEERADQVRREDGHLREHGTGPHRFLLLLEQCECGDVQRQPEAGNDGDRVVPSVQSLGRVLPDHGASRGEAGAGFADEEGSDPHPRERGEPLRQGERAAAELLQSRRGDDGPARGHAAHPSDVSASAARSDGRGMACRRW